MPYASAQDLADAYGADRILMLAATTGPAGGGQEVVRDDAKIARALDSASGVIDGYLSVRYSLPLPTTPATLKDACVAIAVYRLASDPGALTDDMRQRYEDAIAFLKDVAKGIAGIGVLTTAEQRAQQAAGSAALASPQTVLVDADPRVFSRQLLRRL